MKKYLKYAVLSLGLLAFPFAYKKVEAQTKNGSSTGWEYKSINRWREATPQFGGTAQWGNWQSFEDDLTEPLSGNMAQQLNRLGAQGWELVTSEVFLTYFGDNTVQGQTRRMIFKRPLR
jgi:hypothetical protein